MDFSPCGRPVDRGMKIFMYQSIVDDALASLSGIEDIVKKLSEKIAVYCSWLDDKGWKHLISVPDHGYGGQ